MIFKRRITISSSVSSEEIGVERELVFKAFLVIGGEVGLVIVAGSSWGVVDHRKNVRRIFR